jgi:hypothetical protein
MVSFLFSNRRNASQKYLFSMTKLRKSRNRAHNKEWLYHA